MVRTRRPRVNSTKQKTTKETKDSDDRAARHLSRSRKRKTSLNDVIHNHHFEEEDEANKQQSQQSSEEDEALFPEKKKPPNIPCINNNDDQNEDEDDAGSKEEDEDNKQQSQQSSEEDEAPFPEEKAPTNIPCTNINDDQNQEDEGSNVYNVIDLGDLVTNRDRNFVSDAMFLAMSQLQIYHATEETSTPSSLLSSKQGHYSKHKSYATTATANSRGRNSVVGLQCRHCANQQQQQQQQQPWRKRKRRMKRTTSTAAAKTTKSSQNSKKIFSLSSYTYFPSSVINLSQISFLHPILNHFIHKCQYCPVEIRSELQKAQRNTKDTGNGDGDHSQRRRQQQQHDRHFAFFERIWSRMYDTTTHDNTNNDSVTVRNSTSLPSSKHPTSSSLPPMLLRNSSRTYNKLLAKLGQNPNPRRILIPITEGCSGMELSLITATLSRFHAEIVVVGDSMILPSLPSTLHGGTVNVNRNQTKIQLGSRINGGNNATSRSMVPSNKIRIKLKEGHYLTVPMTLEVALTICQDEGWDAIILLASSSIGDDASCVLGTSSLSLPLIELLRYHNLLGKPIGVTGMLPKTIIEALRDVLKLVEPQPRSTAIAKLAEDSTSSAPAILEASVKDKEQLSNHHDSYNDMIVQNNVVVSRGMGVAQLLALQIGEMLYNQEMADCIAKEMLISRAITHRRRKQRRHE